MGPDSHPTGIRLVSKFHDEVGGGAGCLHLQATRWAVKPQLQACRLPGTCYVRHRVLQSPGVCMTTQGPALVVLQMKQICWSHSPQHEAAAEAVSHSVLQGATKPCCHK